jgi:uncharacterized protein involved in response to NO
MAARTRSLRFPDTPPRPAPALLEMGFRPFFLLAGAFGVLAVPVWLLALRGGVTPGGKFGPMQWHAHEMIFGFTTAVIAGFLLTAIGRWTNRDTVRGAPLAALAALWLAGRVALYFAEGLPPAVPAVIDLAFLPALAVVCARPVLAAKNRRNYGFLAMLALLAAANLASHFGALEGRAVLVRSAHVFALNVVGLMMVVMTGRIVPMFTRNATGQDFIRGIPWLERACAAGFVGLLVLDVLPLGASAAGVLSAVVSLLLILRMRYWGSVHTRRDPLLWILHVGALWLPLALLLRALVPFGQPVLGAAALHALTAGAIGSLTLGMMARVSLGHTGRVLVAPRYMPWAFIAVVSAGVVRVGAVFLPPSLYLHALEVSALFWSVAFGVFGVTYFRVLTSPRTA